MVRGTYQTPLRRRMPVKTLPGTLYASPRAGFTPDLQLKALTSVGAPAGLNQAKVNRNGKRLDDR